MACVSVMAEKVLKKFSARKGLRKTAQNDEKLKK